MLAIYLFPYPCQAQSYRTQYSPQHIDSLAQQIDKTSDIKLLKEMIEYLNYFMNQSDVEMELIEKGLNIVQKNIQDKKQFEQLIPLYYTGLGYLYTHKGKKEKANEYFDKTLQIYQAQKDTLLLANFYLQLGSFFYNLNQQEEALQILQKGHALFKPNLYNSSEYRNLLNTKGLVFKKLQNYDRAEQALTQALQISQNLKDSAWIGIISGNLATVLAKKGRLQEALQLLSLDIKTSLQNKLYMSAANALTEVGRIYLQKNELNKARDMLDSALFVIENLATNELVLQRIKGKKIIYDYLANVESKAKNFEKALLYKDKYIAISDTLNQLYHIQKLAQVKGKYEYQDAQKEVKILAKENDIQLNYLYFTIILIAILAFFTIFLVKNIALLKQRSKQIQQQKEDLEALNQTKTLLLSVVGHDFKSPLAKVYGILEFLNNQTITREQAQAVYPDILAQVKHAMNFLESLLKWAKEQQGGLQLFPTKIDLATLCQQIIDDMRAIWQTKNITIINQITSHTFVWADSDTLQIVIRNLLHNAIKFTPEEGYIKLEVTPQENKWLVCISDTGVGIAPTKIPFLFTEKNRSTKSTKNEQGTGLGLLFCKKFIEKNGGIIWVESELNKGTTFYFTIPMLP